MSKVTRQQAIEIVEALIAERGENHRYQYETYTGIFGEEEVSPNCVYTSAEGKPSCIVGQVIAAVSEAHIQSLYVFEWSGRKTPRSRSLSSLGIKYREIFTPKALRYLEILQDRQDRGQTWGDAHAAAEGATR